MSYDVNTRGTVVRDGYDMQTGLTNGVGEVYAWRETIIRGSKPLRSQRAGYTVLFLLICSICIFVTINICWQKFHFVFVLLRFLFITIVCLGFQAA